jgi:heme exporter protein A
VSAPDLRLVGEGLSAIRGGRSVFRDIAFAVSSGEALTVTGPNGAGKSSLIRLVAGLVPIASGSLRLDGAEAERRIGEHCHYAGHLDALKPSLSAEETLSFWRDLYGEVRLQPIEALEALGLDHLADLPAGYLSAGQRRRLALCRLLVSYRPVWLLDEPTSALDRTSQAVFGKLVERHLEGKGIVVVATHGDLGFPINHRVEMAG